MKFGSVIDVSVDELPFVTNGKSINFKKQILNNGDVVMADTAEDEATGKVSEMQGISDVSVVAGLHTFACRPKFEFAGFYLGHYMNSHSYHNQILTIMQGIKVLSVSKGNVSKTTARFPKNIEEQMAIGSFFQNLDRNITLHQRKLDLLKRMKQGFLQQIFPEQGARIPRLRFANFDGEWEQRKLGDYAKYRRGSFPQPYGNREWYDGEGSMPFVQVVDVTEQLSLVDETKQKISKLAQSKSVFVPKGTVVVTLQGSIGRVAITQYGAYVDRTLLIFEEYKEQTEENFWAYIIQQKFDVEKQKAPGGTIKTITKEALSSFEVFLPKYAEQDKVGNFFKELDNLITLHQHKGESLSLLKKFHLQKIFI